MCGLSAVVDFAPQDGLLEALALMHRAVPHRGPDGEGACVVGADWRCVAARSPHELGAIAGASAARVGLAFRWLQIQDSSEAARQPMASSDGAIQLLFNGEIYNFRALRDEMRRLGRVFRSEGDAEVVLCGYELWGSEVFTRLEGMWAIVLLDLRERKLVLSRDRFGIKPLFHALAGSRMLVASEVKQLLAAGIAPSANAPAVMRFIRGGRPEQPEQTFFDSASAFPAAAYAEVDLADGPRELACRSYWRLAPGETGRNRDSLAAACDKLEDLLTRSVADHMVGPVPMGILVSGGLDSSLIAAKSIAPYASRHETGEAFSMVLESGHGGLGEERHIGSVVSAFGLRGHTVQFCAQWLKSEIAAISRVQEEPVAGPAVAGQYLTFGLAARHGMKVALDGQGADEIFGGYPRHQFAYLGELARRRALVDLATEGASLVARDPRLLRQAWRAAFATNRAAAPGFMRAPAGKAPWSPPPDSLDATLRRDVLTGNLRAVLALTDRNAMAHSIEGRVPYVHRPIVEYAFALPDRFKVGAGRRKRVLRALGERLLPRQIVRRRDRIGFGAPIRDWLVEAFVPDLRALPDGPAFRDTAAIDREQLRTYIGAFLSDGHRDAGTVWRLYAVDQWVRAYSVTGI